MGCIAPRRPGGPHIQRPSPVPRRAFAVGHLEALRKRVSSVSPHQKECYDCQELDPSASGRSSAFLGAPADEFQRFCTVLGEKIYAWWNERRRIVWCPRGL